jgi:hypothetical protein
MRNGEVVPDWVLVTGPGAASARLWDLCPGAAVLIFLRHLA